MRANKLNDSVYAEHSLMHAILNFEYMFSCVMHAILNFEYMFSCVYPIV